MGLEASKAFGWGPVSITQNHPAQQLKGFILVWLQVLVSFQFVVVLT